MQLNRPYAGQISQNGSDTVTGPNKEDTRIAAVDRLRSVRNRTALIVERDRALRQVMLLSLIQLGLKVRDVGSYEDGERLLDQFMPDILIMDFDYPEGRNAQLIESYRERLADEVRPVIVTTTQRLKDSWRRQCEPISVLYKPFDVRLLVKKLVEELANRPDSCAGG
jgi:DNA-binding response OmpR family regulator